MRHMDGAIRAVHPSMVHCFLIGETGGAEVDRGEGSGGFCRDSTGGRCERVGLQGWGEVGRDETVCAGGEVGGSTVEDGYYYYY